MKKTIVLIAVLVCTFISAVTAQAADEKSEYVSVDVSAEAFDSIVPGDTFTRTITVQNTESQTVKVRLLDVENVDASVLYDVLRAEWESEAGDGNLAAIDDLVAAPFTEWHTLAPGERWELQLKLHFPAECGNQYQGTALAARFTFEIRIPEGTTPPYTGDSFRVLTWAALTGMSACAVIALILIRKRKVHNNSTNEGDIDNGGNNESKSDI